jgi:hypothetical protein
VVRNGKNNEEVRQTDMNVAHVGPSGLVVFLLDS